MTRKPGLLSVRAMDIVIRAELPGEEKIIDDLHLAAFGEEKLPRLLAALRSSGHWRYSFVAEAEGEVVGHVAFTRGWVDAPERLAEVAVLSPLGVRPDVQKRGVGRALVAHGVSVLAGEGWPVVFLEGDPRYYSRLGWEAGGPHGFEPPSTRIPAPAFQIVKLPAYEPWITGRLVYPEAFWLTDSVGLRG
ncbi:N-acetyltransferase [Actinorhabdospora filicis]|uniref:N-acetyltransferase n=2 Tax=Actinorhabdospora filicis TaxID=1785913 RepID=A0A9W6WB43_9ACTN|nr:N-acetyltransferase [Actinorhabdospora filicis]